jgi:hypothetical protein
MKGKQSALAHAPGDHPGAKSELDELWLRHVAVLPGGPERDRLIEGFGT